MTYQLVSIKTKDGLVLHGLLNGEGKKTVLINIHGTASNFYEESFVNLLAETLPVGGVDVLTVNNRGTYVMDAYQSAGAALEKFEDCTLDIDGWIDFARSEGYKDIILQGHSLGAEKVVYYMSNGKHRKTVKAVILLEFADSYGTQMRYLSKKKDRGKGLMAEAKKLVGKGKGNIFLTTDWLSNCGETPMSAATYINFFDDGSELSKALPFRNEKELPMYRKIRVPTLAIVGDQNKYTIIPMKDALRLLKKENNLTEVHQIRNCNHIFEGKENELAKIIDDFLRRLKI